MMPLHGPIQMGNHLMRHLPQRQVMNYVDNYRTGRLIDPPFKPKILPVIDTPSPSLVRDPVLKLAKAEEDYSSLYSYRKPKKPQEYHWDILGKFEKEREERKRIFGLSDSPFLK